MMGQSLQYKFPVGFYAKGTHSPLCPGSVQVMENELGQATARREEPSTLALEVLMELGYLLRKALLPSHRRLLKGGRRQPKVPQEGRVREVVQRRQW